MRLDRRHGEVELGRDLGVGEPAADATATSRSRSVSRSIRDPAAAARSSARARPHLAQQGPGGRRRQHRPRRRRRGGSRSTISVGGVSLSRNPSAPAATRPDHVLVGVEGGQHDHRGRVAVAVQGARRLEPVHHRHPDVHQHDVGTQRRGLPQALGAVTGLADDVEVALAAEHERQRRAHQGSSSTISTEIGAPVDPLMPPTVSTRGARTACPVAPCSRRPPRSSARSARPIRPRPAPGASEACEAERVAQHHVEAVARGHRRPRP